MNKSPGICLRVALVGPASSPHVQRWAAGLAERGCAVTVFTQHPADESATARRYATELLPFRGTAGYFLNAPALRARLRAAEPDLVHAHYLSGYATMARLSGAPYIVSVWGSDIFSFPRGSAIKRCLIAQNLAGAKRILSTSHAMEREIRLYCEPSKSIAITPFGVDTTLFSPRESVGEGVFTVGMIKNLEPSCGGECLIRAFAALRRDDPPENPSRLLVAGDGPERPRYEALARELEVDDRVEFVGHLCHDEVPRFLGRLDVYCGPSLAESFGVAFLEAQSVGLPVVASRVGGIPEVVLEGESGFLEEAGDVAGFARRLAELRDDPGLRRDMGRRGRDFADRAFSWGASIDIMLAVYADVLGKTG